MQNDTKTEQLYISPTFRIPSGIAKFTIGQWNSRFGNHRAVVHVEQAQDAVCAYLPWRRRDAFPQTKHILVMDRNQEVVKNSITVSCNKEYGEVVFQPTAGVGEYYLYYLPPCDDKNAMVGIRRPCPIHRYMPAHVTADEKWLRKHHLTHEELQTIPQYCPAKPVATDSHIDVYTPTWRDLPEAVLVEFQARGQWHSFYPMETICTVIEQRQLVKMCNYRPFILFPEDRTNPIRMTDQLPYKWAIRNEQQLDHFSGIAQRNEYYVFQVGVYASQDCLDDIHATCSDFTTADGQTIPAGNTTCFNLGGVDQHGREFVKTVHVDKGKVQALWFGVDIPESTRPGTYNATLTISAGRHCLPPNIRPAPNVNSSSSL